MGLILDIIVVAIIVINIIIGIKRGFVKTAVETVGFFLAVYLSFSFCTPIAEFVSEKTVRPAIVSSINETIADPAQTIISDQKLTEAFDKLPNFVRNLVERANINAQTISDKLESSAQNSTASVAERITDTVVMPLVNNLFKIIAAIILFIILIIVIKIIAKLINGIFKLPLLDGLNKGLGVAFGGVYGVVVATVVCVVVTAVIAFNDKGFLIFTPENIAASSLFELLCGFSPFK